MKNLITATAVLVLLLVLLSEFVHQQVLFMKTQAVEQAMESFCRMEAAGSTPAFNEEQLKVRVSSILDCSREQILVERKVQTQEKKMYYVLQIPIEKIVAAPEFWGIGDNQGVLRIERETVYE